MTSFREPAVDAGTVRHWPGMRSEYAWLAAHEGATVTKPHQIGIAFSGHERLVYDSGDGRIVRDVPPGSTIVSGDASITWLRVSEPTEALEIYPDPALGMAIGDAASRPGQLEQVIWRRDAVVLGIASTLRRAHVSDLELSDMAASTLAHRLVTHLLTAYAGVVLPDRPTRGGRIDRRRFDAVADFVEAELGRVITLDAVAAQAGLSAYHFARVFKQTTGLTPHAFVTARRMDRARVLLWTSNRTVEDVARTVGFNNISHFRRMFRRHHGLVPSELRRLEPRTPQSADDSKNGPSAGCGLPAD